MSGWPWMKGIEKAWVDAPPPPPPDDNDSNGGSGGKENEGPEQEEEAEAEESRSNTSSTSNSNNNNNKERNSRPSIHELMEEYKELITVVQTELKENDVLYDATKHDELWILRFLLSHKKDTDKALAAAKSTLQFRQQHHLDEYDLRNYPPQDFQKIASAADNIGHHDGFLRWMKGGIGTAESIHGAAGIPSPNKNNNEKCQSGCGGVYLYINVATLDTHKLADVSAEDWLNGMNYVNEWSFQWLDYLTRTTGYLVKAVRVVNVEGISLSMENRQTQDLYTNATKIMQDCYPQAVGIILVCHAPSWIQIPWYVLKLLLPKRVVSKIDFINPKNRVSDRDIILGLIHEEHLPERFGGRYPTWPPNFPLPMEE